jgi:hypothetical protein
MCEPDLRQPIFCRPCGHHCCTQIAAVLSQTGDRTQTGCQRSANNDQRHQYFKQGKPLIESLMISVLLRHGVDFFEFLLLHLKITNAIGLNACTICSQGKS